MRYSNSGEQNLEISLILDFVQQLLFINRHRLPPLVLLGPADLSWTKNPESSTSRSATTLKKMGYYRFSDPIKKPLHPTPSFFEHSVKNRATFQRPATHARNIVYAY